MPIGFVSLGLVDVEGVSPIVYASEITAYVDPVPCNPCNYRTSNQMTIFKGDSHAQIFQVLSGVTPVDITGALLTFTVKKRESDATELFNKQNEDAGGDVTQIEMTDPANGTFTVFIDPADTLNAEGNVKYWYDVEMNLNGNVKTIIKDRIYIKQDIT